MEIPVIWRMIHKREGLRGLQREREGGGIEVSFTGNSWHALENKNNENVSTPVQPKDESIPLSLNSERISADIYVAAND